MTDNPNAFRDLMFMANLTPRQAAKMVHASEHAVSRWLSDPLSARYQQAPMWAVELLRYRINDRRKVEA